ncbi:MAG: hypothetical protein WC568_00555 [Candidatus Methanoperedens sp.]
MRFRCFFHNLIVPPRTTEEEILKLFTDIETETHEENPFYSNQSDYRVLLRNERKVEDSSDDTEKYFQGKMVKSEKEIDYGEENEGNLLDLTVEEGAGIFNKRIGVVYYLFYLNRITKKHILMLEYVPFTIGSGTFVRYLNERLGSAEKKIEVMQIAGKNFEAYLNSIGSSYINVANIRLKKYVSDEAMQKIGVIDDILKLVNDKEDFSVELTVHWYKKKRQSVTQFLQNLTHKEQISDIAMTNFSELFRTFAFEIENSAQPNVDLLDRLLRFEVETEKLDMSDAMIYTQMFNFFIANKTQII